MTICVCMFYSSVFVHVGTEIPSSITSLISVPSFIVFVLLTFGSYQFENWKIINNALYIVLFFVGGAAIFALVALHWSTREQMIRKITIAEKKIKKAKKFFFFGAKETV